jgi:hypothetical protein
MTTQSSSAVLHQGLYCVWIATGNPRRPFACVWIDPETRSSGLEYVHQFPVPFSKIRLGRVGRRRRWAANTAARLRSLALITIALLISPDAARADIGGRISGLVTDPRSVLVSGAIVTLSNTSDGTKRTTVTNSQGQYSNSMQFDVVS